MLKFARFLTIYDVKQDTLSYMMRLIDKSDNDYEEQVLGELWQGRVAEEEAAARYY